MSIENLRETIEKAFDNRDEVTPATTGEVSEAVEEALNLMDGANSAWPRRSTANGA